MQAYKEPHTAQFKLAERTNASMHPILNEKIYKIQFSNPKAVIDNLEPEIAKIKGLSINNSQKKIVTKSYERAIKNMKNANRKMNEEINSAVGQLPLKDIEQLKKKNKLLEYIILQRSKNRLKLENDKRVFELEYNSTTAVNNTNEGNNVNNYSNNNKKYGSSGDNNIIKDSNKGSRVKDSLLNPKQCALNVNNVRQIIGSKKDAKNIFFPKVINVKNAAVK